MAKDKFQLIVALINAGFSDLVMDAVRAEGAGGGTIIRARGTGKSEMEKKYGIIITPDKEAILIVSKKEDTDKIMTSIYKCAGMNTKGQGICFALPIDDVVGLKF